MNGHDDQVTRELLALLAPDPASPRIDRVYVRHMLAEAWQLGHSARSESAAANPFPFPDTRTNQ